MKAYDTAKFARLKTSLAAKIGARNGAGSAARDLDSDARRGYEDAIYLSGLQWSVRTPIADFRAQLEANTNSGRPDVASGARKALARVSDIEALQEQAAHMQAEEARQAAELGPLNQLVRSCEAWIAT